MEQPKTIFKVRASRRTQEVWSLAKILFGLLLVISVIGGLQVGLCKKKFPKKTVLQCAMPLKDKINGKDKKQR